MRRWAFLFVFCLIITLLSVANDTVCASETVSSFVVSDISYEVYPSFSRLAIASNEKVDFIYYELEDPYRIVIDLIGVSFCELEERLIFNQGLIKNIDIIKTPYAKNPDALDEFFYAVDYLIITPASRVPYTVISSEDGKVIAIDIGQKDMPQLKVSQADFLEANQALASEAPSGEYEAKPAQPEPIQALEPLPKQHEEQLLQSAFDSRDEIIIDRIYYELLDDSSLIILTSNKSLELKVIGEYKPGIAVKLKPTQPIFTELEEKAVINDGYIGSINIVNDIRMKSPKGLGDYFYSVEYILISLPEKRTFDFYSNAEGTISVLEIPHKGTKKKEDISMPDDTPGVTRTEILRELIDEMKAQGLIKHETIKELSMEYQERRNLEAERLSDIIGREIVEGLLVKGQGMLSLTQAQNISLRNSPAAEVSKEEVKLAKMKKDEAFRALFPQVKVRGTHTTGDVMGADFIEEVYGVQAEHPLYQGGRLVNTYKQSKINLKLASARYVKVKNELNYKVAEAYYNAVTAIMNIRLQQELLGSAENIYNIAKKRYNSGLSTKLEVLGVESHYNQIQYQLATAERDIALAKFKLKQAMNLDIAAEEVDTAEIDSDLKFKPIEVDLDECLMLASENQPDIVVNKFLVNSNEYGEKIAKGKSDFKIDLTGFLGKSDSYYDTEPRNLQKDWNIGVKVTKPFWAVTPSYAFAKDRTSRKVGMDDRTGSASHTGELAIVDKDSLSAYTEIEEAKINRQKAQNDLIESRRQTALEIKEAYYNYQESILQVRNVLEKVRFNEEAVKTAHAQAGLNEALQSQHLEALVKLYDEKTVFVKTLSDYNLALAKLNKAIGIEDYFSVD